MCVRIDASDPPAPAVRELQQRMIFAVRPALALLAPDGDVLHVQYARLYPAYHFNGVEMSSWSEALWTSKDILALVDRVEARRKVEDARLEALARESGAAALVERATILAGRARPERARALFERALEQGMSVEAAEPLAALHAKRTRPDDARALYARLLAHAPEHPRAESWQHQAARLLALQVDRAQAAAGAEPDAVDPTYAAALADLRRLAKRARDPAVRIQSALSLGRVAYATAERAALSRLLEPLAAKLDPNGDCPAHWTPAMLLELSDLELVSGGRFEARATAHAWMLSRCFPDSVEAQRIKHGMLDGNIRTAPR